MIRSLCQPAGGQAGQQGCVLLGPGTHGAVLHTVRSRAAAKRRRLAACGPGRQVLLTAGEGSLTTHASFRHNMCQEQASMICSPSQHTSMPGVQNSNPTWQHICTARQL